MTDFFKCLEEYNDQLFCRECGNDSKRTFVYSRTVANGEVWLCKKCKMEKLCSEKPNEDNYNEIIID